MLGRMLGVSGDGQRGRLMDFWRQVSRAFDYQPPLDLIADLRGRLPGKV